MALLRILLIVALIGTIYLIIMKLFSFRESDKTPSKISKMVACEFCGVYIPEDEVVVEDLRNFCCTEHMTMWLKNNADNT